MSEDPAVLALLERRSDPDARRELVARYDPLARRLAMRYRGRGEPLDDLVQVSRLGLVNALERFDPTVGAKFSTFATRTILGELKRHLRDKTWAVRVPRSLQELWLEAARAREDLTHRLDRSPTIDEIAAEIGATREDVLEAMDAGSVYSSESLDAPVGDPDSASLGDLIGMTDGALESAGLWASLVEVINELPERERTILIMRFFGDQAQSEIGDALGISQMHVSRLLRRSLSTLKEKLGAVE